MKQYTVDYFINKFEAIPEGKWCVREFKLEDKYCAYGHLGMTDHNSYYSVPEADAFGKILLKATSINDGDDPKYQQPTPKQRILAALYDIKKLQYPELSTTTVEDIIRKKVLSDGFL